jgi:nitrite reductase (NO-forming)
MSAHPASTRHRAPIESHSGAFFKVASMLLGIAVAVVGFFALMMWADTRESRQGDGSAQAASAPTTHDHAKEHNTALPLNSFAGVVPANSQALAEAHKAYEATLPPAPAGSLAKVHMTLKDMTLEVAPGVKYSTWSFDGHGAPGPTIHVREGQTVEMTLTNGGAIPHSIDFHAPASLPTSRSRT